MDRNVVGFELLLINLPNTHKHSQNTKLERVGVRRGEGERRGGRGRGEGGGGETKEREG